MPHADGPHHNRTRSSEEQRGPTVNGAEPNEAIAKPFSQTSVLIGTGVPQLPKLRASML